MANSVEFIDIEVIFVAKSLQIVVYLARRGHQIFEETLQLRVDLVLRLNASLDPGAEKGHHKRIKVAISVNIQWFADPEH